MNSSILPAEGRAPAMRQLLARGSALFTLLMCFGCMGGPPPGNSTGGTGGPTCAPGSAVGPDGACVQVGIQGCADLFIENNGLCLPALDKCPRGTIPKFDEGCVPIGIQGCAAIFVEDDGLCHPSMAKCPKGTIPQFDEGCVPVGIQGCAAMFMEEDGLCHPTMAKCPEGTFAAPQEGCVPIDGPAGCGTDTWGNLPDAPNTVYVDPADPGASGDGSKAKPLKTLFEALALVQEGGRIALAAGTYDEPLEITKGIEVAGRCPSMVRVQGTTMAHGYPVIVWVNQAAGVTLRGIEIGGKGIGIMADGAMDLTVERAHIRNATVAGLLAFGGSTVVSMMESWIEGTLPRESDKTFGRGVEAESGARVTLTSSALVGNRGAGVLAGLDDTEVTATGNLIEGTLPQENDHTSGQGVRAKEGARVTLTSNALIANHEAGLIVFGKATQVEATGNLVEGTVPREIDKSLGTGVAVIGAPVTLTSNALVANHYVGLYVSGSGAEVNATGNLIEGTLSDESDKSFGRGVSVLEGARATLTSNALVANHDFGAFVFDSGTELTATSNLIEGTLPRESDGRFGRGVGVGGSAQAALMANALVANHEVGLMAFQSGTKVTATSNIVEGTLPQANEKTFGRGVHVQAGAGVTLTSTALVANHEFGLYVRDEGSELMVTGSLVEGTLPRESDGELGVGIGCDTGSRLTLTFSVVQDNRVVAVLVAESTADITESLLSFVSAGKFTALNPMHTFDGVGDGILATSGATVTVADTWIHECARVGILFDNSSGSLASVTSTSNRYGLVLQGSPQPTYDKATCDFSGNQERSVVPQGNLPVPNAPLDVPEAP